MHVDFSILQARQELALAAHGALAVAETHLQLAKQHAGTTETHRMLNDHLDTATVFIDSAMMVLATITEMVRRLEEQEVSLLARTA